MKRPIRNIDDLDIVVDEICGLFKLHGKLTIEISGVEMITPAQMNSLHLYFTNVADDLNNAGYDIERTLKKNFRIPWRKETFKELVWRTVQEPIVGYTSTTKLEKSGQLDDVLMVVQEHLATLTEGVVTTKFPDRWGP